MGIDGAAKLIAGTHRILCIGVCTYLDMFDEQHTTTLRFFKDMKGGLAEGLMITDTQGNTIT